MAAQIDFEVLLRLAVDDSQARAALTRLQAMAAESGSLAGVGTGGADETARLLAQLQARSKQQAIAERGGATTDEARAAATQAASARSRELNKLAAQVATGLPTDDARAFMARVGTTPARNDYARQLKAEESAANALPGTPQEVRGRLANMDRTSAIEDEAARLRVGREMESLTQALLELDVETRRFHATMEELRAASETYTEASIEAATAHQRSARSLAAAQAADENYLNATVQATAAREQLRDRLTLQAAGETGEGLTPVQMGDRAAELRRQQGIETQTRRTAAIGPEETAARGALTVEQARLRNNVREAADAEGEFTAEVIRSAAFQKALADEVAINVAGFSEARVATFGSREAAAVEARKVVANQRNIEAIEGETAAELANAARLNTLQTERRAAIQNATRAELRPRILRGEFGGSLPERLIGGATGRIPTGDNAVGSLLATRGISSLTHMATGFASGALLFGIIEAVKEASKLQETLAGLQGQMEALGQGNQFTQVRDQIKSISDETGVAASDVTKFTARLLGVFDDPARALEETSAAMKLAVVSGTDLNTMLEEMVPVMRAFNVSAEEMGDLAVYIHDKFGIAEEQTLHFFGETASTAEEAGLSLTQLGVIGASAANSIGKSMTATGEQFTKVLGTMSENQDKIFAILRRRPETAPLADPVVAAFSQGEVGQAFQLLLQDYDRLDKVQQDSLIRVMGSRREWALLNGIFQHSGELITDLAAAEGAQSDAAGGLDRRFRDVSNTLQRTTDRVKELFKNIVEGIISSGVGAGIGVIVAALEQMLKVANIAITVFNTLNEATKIGPFDSGILAFLTSMAAILFTVQKAYAAFNGAKALGARASDVLAAAEQKLGVASEEAAGGQALERGAIVSNTEAKVEAALASGVPGAGVVPGASIPVRPGGALEAPIAPIAAGEAIAVNSAGEALVGNAEQRVVSSGLTELAKDATAAGAGGGAMAVLSRGWGSFTGGLSAIGSKLAGLGSMEILPALGLAGPALAGVISGLVSSNFARDAALTGGGPTPFGTNVQLPGISNIPYLGDAINGILSGPGSSNLQANESQLTSAASKLGREELEKRAQESMSLMDKFQSAFFDIDMPQTIFQKELDRRQGAEGRTMTTNLLQTGQMATFVQGISDANAKNLEDFLKQTDAQDFTKQFGLLDDKGKLNRDKLQAAMPEISKLSETGDRAANLFLAGVHDIEQRQASFAELRKRITDALNSRVQSDAIAEVGGIEAFMQAQYDPKGALAIGAITPVQYLSNLDQQIEDKRRGLAGKGGEEAAKAYQELNALIKEREDFVFNQQKERIERLTRVVAETGTNTPAADALKILLEELPRVDPTHQFEMLDQVHKASADAFNESLKTIRDPAELYRRQVEGYQVSLQEQSLDMQNQARQIDSASKLLGRMAAQAGMGEGGAIKMSKEIADLAAQDNISFAEAAKKIYAAKIAALQAMGGGSVFVAGEDVGPAAQIAKYQALLDAINGGAFEGIDPQKTVQMQQREADQQRIENEQRNREAAITLQRSQNANQGRRAQAQLNLRAAQSRLQAANERFDQLGGPTAQADVDEAQAAVNDALRESAKVTQDIGVAMLNWDVIAARGDPVKETAARTRIAARQVQNALTNAGGDVNDPEVIRAQQELAQLQIQAEDNQLAIVRSRFSIGEAQNQRHPVETARLALEKARFETANAKGEADRNEKLAAEIRAEHSYEDAIQSVFSSRASLMEAIANANGDSVEALRIARDEAQRKLDVARSQGLTGDELNPFLQQVVESNEAFRKGGLQRQQQIIDFQLAMGEITTDTAIASFKLLLQQTRQGTDEYMALAQKIHSLEQSASDLQFNLPTQLGLPTLYEARRVSQGAAMGIGYQDNRQVAVVVNVNGAQDPAATAAQVMSAFQSAAGSSPVYTGGVIGAGV